MKATRGGYGNAIIDVWKVNRHGEVGRFVIFQMIYTIILLKSAVVRKLQVAILHPLVSSHLRLALQIIYSKNNQKLLQRQSHACV